MSDSVVKRRNDKKLKELAAGIVKALGEALSTLVDREANIKLGSDLQIVEVEDWLSSLSGQKSVLRGALDKDLAGKHLLFIFDSTEAVTLSGCLMMTPQEVIEERRAAGVLEGEDLEAFGEVGNVLCSGADGLLREMVGPNVGLRVQDHGVVKPGLDKEGLLGDGTLVLYSFDIQVSGFSETEGFIALDPETAEKLNEAPLQADEHEGLSAPKATASSQDAHDGTEDAEDEEEEEEEEIPQAPTRGQLAAFLADSGSYGVLRRCCRRVGLELQRFSRTDIPNPAAHKGKIVLIEVSVGEERRFEWAKRLKQYQEDITVVLLLHKPSRNRVIQGFLAKADVILGWPCKEPQISAKLDPLLSGARPGGGED